MTTAECITDSVSGFGGLCAFRKYLTSCDSCVKLHENSLLSQVVGSVFLPKAVIVNGRQTKETIHVHLEEDP